MRPSLRCVLLFAAGVPVALLAALVGRGLWTLWASCFALSLLLCAFDAVFGVARRRVRADVAAPETLYIGDREPLAVTIRVADRAPPPIEVLADLSANLAPQPPARLRPAGAEARHEIPLVPLRRGKARVHTLWLRWTGPLGLVRRTLRHRCEIDVPVIPNVKAVRHAALRFFSAREFLSGQKVERYVGDGSEFESLREYVAGLDHRALNWKASARHRKLLCEEFRAERNHQVVLALDTGHLMGQPLAGIPKLDHAINAGLLLSYVCLRTGDRVGWFTFDAQVRSYTEPAGGTAAFRRLQQQTSAAAYSTAETNFTLALTDLSVRLRRRSLIVLLTDFTDTITAELMIDNLARLSRRHLVLFVTLRDPELVEMAHARPAALDVLHRAVVAADFVRERDRVLRKLARLGVHTIDVPPQRVTTDLLNRYLEVKRREMV
ncbi:MAG TPA: DUF58 domain-containing protein [Planctomycetota bacterium]|nr:DUF58 domain-containing protein [Planctomycetota bacterium]